MNGQNGEQKNRSRNIEELIGWPVFWTCRINPFPRIAGPPRRRFIEIQYNASQVLVNSRKEALVWPGLPPRHRHLTWQKGGNHRLSFDMVYFLPVLMGWVLHSGEICVNIYCCVLRYYQMLIYTQRCLFLQKKQIFFMCSKIQTSHNAIKGTVHRFYKGGPRNPLQFGITVCFKCFKFFRSLWPLLSISWCNGAVQNRQFL